MSEINVTDKNFEQEVLKSTLPVLVDFWAEWCGPCKRIAPTVEEIAKEFEGKLKVCKLNVEENPKTSSKYNITAIPALLFFKEGKAIESLVGFREKEELKKIIGEKVLHY